MHKSLLSGAAADQAPQPLLRKFLLLLVLLGAALGSHAQTTIYGLGTVIQNVPPGGLFFPAGATAGEQGVVAFDPVSGLPNSAGSLQKIVVAPGGPALVGKLVGIDFRPATGQMYALGYDRTQLVNNAQLYTLNQQTGVVTPVSAAPITLALGDSIDYIGFNFNPVADLIRVVSNNDSNYRLSPVTGQVVVTGGVDTPLNYAVGDQNFGRNPRVQGVAYTNSRPGATTTELYDVDTRNSVTAPPGILSLQSPPNAGTLNTKALLQLDLSGGPFGIDGAARVNIDIYWTGTYNKGYLLERTKPNTSGFSSSNLYDLSLPASATSPNDPTNTKPAGYASNKRALVPAGPGTAFNLHSIAVAPNPTITSLAPPSAAVGTPGLTLTVNGTGFVNGTVVNYNGAARTTTFVSTTQLTAALTAADLSTVGAYSVTVTNPPFPGTPSDPATFYVEPVCTAPSTPTVSSITNTSATVSFSGSNSNGYTVSTSPGTTTQTLPAGATSANLTGLAPGTTYTVTVTGSCASATPGGPATSSAPVTATFTTTNPQLAVSQGGTSYPSNGAAYSFGTRTVGSPSSPVAFTLTNNGPDPLTISGITTTGDYAVSGATPTTVAANGGTATVSVIFTPTAPGTRPGTLVISSNAANGATYTVNLTGTGQAAVPNPQIAVSQGGTGIANGGTFSGFPSTQVGSTSAPVSFTIDNGSSTDALTLGTFTFSGPYALSGAAPTSVAPGGSATFSVTFSPTAVGTNTGSVSIPNNSQSNNPFVINFSGQGTSQDLVVSTPQAVQGSYRNVTVVGPNGVASLSGTLTVSGTLAVQSGGILLQNCQLITGGGSFDLQAGGTLGICDPAGITTSGATGAVQVAGSRSFSPLANYVYNGSLAQVTGNALPGTVLAVGVQNAAGLTLSQGLSLTQGLNLSLGNLTTGGQPLTLLSNAANTAGVVNTNGVVVGTVTVQRYITPNNPGLGYRHYSSPVANSTVADLTTAGFTPVVNSQYNTVGGAAVPFPNVFGYDETRVTTSGNPSPQDFDRGWFSPSQTSDPLEVTRGYTVNINSSETVDFVGTLNNGTLTASGLTYGNQTTSGYHLRGNPYPSPLDWQLMTSNGRLTNIDPAVYVFKSSGQYTGSYASYNNGVSVNGGSRFLALGQGFFVRASTPGTAGSIAFTNAERVTTANNPTFQRGTADARTQLLLSLRHGTVANQTAIYFDRLATAGFDGATDAYALPPTHGLVLASETAGSTEALAINGQPLLNTADVLVPLRLAATAGTYTLAVDNLANLPAGYYAYLRDNLTGTYTNLATTPTLALTVAANAPAAGRYAVLFTKQARVLATAPAALAQLATVYPNPAHGSATLLLPVALRGKSATSVSVVDNLGRTVLTRTLAAGPTETLELPLTGLAPGVYSVLARTSAGLVAKRLVVQ